MRNFYLSFAGVFIFLASAFGQFDATFTITDAETALPIENVEVFLDNVVLYTDVSGQVVFNGLSNGTYPYSYSVACYPAGNGSLTIADANVDENISISASTTNDVFFFVGSPLTINGAFVELFNNDGYYQSLTTGSGGPFGNDIISEVPYGEYSYVITTPCYETVSGTVTVDCNGGNGSLVEANPAPTTTNDVFFFVGSPLTINGAFVELFNNDGYYQSLTTGSGGPFGNDIISEVPYGEYSYVITTPCYETVSGTVTVDCNGGNGSLVEANPAPTTTNDVFFFVGSPLTINGAFVELFNNDGYYQSLTTGSGGPFGNDIISEVPYGEYSYVITTPCYETVSGTVTVDCNGGNGSLVEANPAPTTTNDVFFFVGSPLTINGAFVELFNNDGYYQSLTTGSGGPFGNDIISEVPYGEYSYVITTPCYETVSGTVTVDCNGGNGSLVEANPAEATTNDVFFFIGDPFTISGATVTVTDGADFNQSLVTGAPFGDMLAGVPYGEYTFTVEAECYETISGSFTVDCNEGLGTVVAENPSPIVIDNSVSQDANVLTADADGYSYQWIDCDNANAEIEGATEQSFTAAANGNYAVIISGDNCSIVSDCVEVIGLGIFEKQSDLEVTAFPNPVVNKLNIQLESITGDVAVKVISITGHIIMNESFNSSELIQLNVSQLATGTYILNVTNNEGVYTTHFVKQ